MRYNMVAKRTRSGGPHLTPSILPSSHNTERSQSSEPRSDIRGEKRGSVAHGNYQQLFHHYTNLAKELLTMGDRVGAEFNYQYADHYLRLLNDYNRASSQRASTVRPSQPPIQLQEPSPSHSADPVAAA